MNNEEYLQQRILISEQVIRVLMSLLQHSNPHMVRDINNLGESWNNKLDSLDQLRSL